MRSLTTKELSTKHFNLSITDNSKSAWPLKQIVKRLELALPYLETFLYSDKTRVDKKLHPQISLDLNFCGDTRMKTINSAYREKNKTTDVLSFPGFSNLRSDKKSDVYPGMVHLGDIIISRDVAKRQAKEFKITLEEEVLHLFVHGFLHLVGYDHEISIKEEVLMEKLEEEILLKISKKNRK